MLNRTGTVLPVTGLWLDFAPLITMRWAQLYSLLSIHFTLYSSSPYMNRSSTGFLSCPLGSCIEGGQSQKSSWSHNRKYPLFSPFLPAPYCIMEVYQVVQAWLSLDEYMLTSPDDFLVLHVPANGFPNLVAPSNHQRLRWGKFSCVGGQPWLVVRLPPGHSLNSLPQQHSGRKKEEKPCEAQQRQGDHSPNSVMGKTDLTWED